MKKIQTLLEMEIGTTLILASTAERIRLDAAQWHAAAKKVSQIAPERVFQVRKDAIRNKVYVKRVDQELPFEKQVYNSSKAKIGLLEPGQRVYYNCPEGKDLRGFISLLSSLASAAKRKRPGSRYSVRRDENGGTVYRIN
jgi:hypothetical protein